MPPNHNNSLSGKKILIIHFRVGKTDGVSLQIASWKKILERAGAHVGLCAGPISTGADYSIKRLEYTHPDIKLIEKESQRKLNRFKSEAEFQEFVEKQTELIRQAFEKIISDFHPTHLIVCNIFSIGFNFPAAIGLAELIETHRLKTIAIHSDFFWEANRRQEPSCPYSEKIIGTYLPPKSLFIQHLCINSLARKVLKKLRGITSGLLHDTHDFDQKPWRVDFYNADLPKKLGLMPDDFVILQATRIVRRKAIELAIDFANTLNQPRFKNQLAGVALPGRAPFDPQKNSIYLVLAGYAEKRDLEYARKIDHYAKSLRLKIIHAGDYIRANRSLRQEKYYTLWDIYPRSDLITYTSTFEGFGNQFLEAVFAKKPIVVFEYPVFRSDIAPKGFSVISLGKNVTHRKNGLVKVNQKTLENAAQKTIDFLTNPDRYQQLVERNWQIGKENFSHKNAYSVLKKLLV